MTGGALERQASAEVTRQGGGAAMALRSLNPDDLAILRETFAKGATDAELAIYLAVAQEHRLNPFVGEIWCVKRKATEPATIQIGRDGYLAHAERHPAYDGMHSDVVREGDTFEARPMAGEIDHRYTATRGAILGAFAIVWRKDRRTPFYFWAPFDEFKAAADASMGGRSPVWGARGSQMILKSAEKGALQRAFRITVDDDPIHAEIDPVEREAAIRDERGYASAEDGGPVIDVATGAVVDGVGENAWRVRWSSLKAYAIAAGITETELAAIAKGAGAEAASALSVNEIHETFRDRLDAEVAARRDAARQAAEDARRRDPDAGDDPPPSGPEGQESMV